MASAASSRVLALSVLALFTAGCGDKPQGGAPPPAEVGVVKVSEQPVPLELTYMARTTGVREVEVRARVSGILLRRLYKEGEPVKEGALLFRIDPAPYEAEAARARAQVGVASANAAEAARQLKRTEPLVQQGVVSRREYDESVAASESAEAALNAAKAALRTAQLNLEYTQVRAPISGLTSREARSEGSLVNANDDSALLTRISQTDQLYVQFSLPVNEAALIRNALQQGAPVQVIVQTADGRELPERAKLEFVDTLVDESSGTVDARATLAGGSVDLLPGQFVRARVAGITLPAAVVVPSRGVLRSPMGAMVWVVGSDNKVQPRPVQLGQTTGNNTVVASGLKAGEQVIVDGVIKVQPGVVVKPVAAAEAQAAPPPATAGR